MAKTAFKQCDVARLIKGAIAGGLEHGTFGVQLIDGKLTLIPVDAPLHTTKVAEYQSALSDDAAIEALIFRHGQG